MPGELFRRNESLPLSEERKSKVSNQEEEKLLMLCNYFANFFQEVQPFKYNKKIKILKSQFFRGKI